MKIVFLGEGAVSYERGTPCSKSSVSGCSHSGGAYTAAVLVHGYLTYKKAHPPRTLP